MKSEDQKFARLIRILRKESGLSQADIAKRLGITRPAYTYYESGRALANLMTFRKLAEIFQVSVEVLIYFEQYEYK